MKTKQISNSSTEKEVFCIDSHHHRLGSINTIPGGGGGGGGGATAVVVVTSRRVVVTGSRMWAVRVKSCCNPHACVQNLHVFAPHCFAFNLLLLPVNLSSNEKAKQWRKANSRKGMEGVKNEEEDDPHRWHTDYYDTKKRIPKRRFKYITGLPVPLRFYVFPF